MEIIPNSKNLEINNNFTDSSSITKSHNSENNIDQYSNIYENISHDEYDDCITKKKINLVPPHIPIYDPIQNHIHISNNIPIDVQQKLKKIINIFFEAKIIAIQACNSLTSTFCEKFIIIKLTNLLDNIQKIYSDLLSNYFSTIDSNMYDQLILNYEQIISELRIEKYVNLILMIDDGIFKLKKFLISF